jgi:hypothetical protein
MTERDSRQGVDMRAEAEMTALFDEVVQELDPAVDVIVGRAERQGRRMRSRRMAYMAAGNALAVGAIVAASVAIGTTGGPSGAPVVAGAAGAGASAGGSTGASPSPSPGHGRRHHPMGQRQILAMLRTMLPGGSTISHVRKGLLGQSVEFDYNDGKGAVDFILEIQPASMKGKPPLGCPQPPWNGDEGRRPAGALPISCVLRTLADGSTELDMVTGADGMSFYGYNIHLIRPDHVEVFLQVGNGINHVLPRVDRARPPGSIAEWTALVESPAWHL